MHFNVWTSHPRLMAVSHPEFILLMIMKCVRWQYCLDTLQFCLYPLPWEGRGILYFTWWRPYSMWCSRTFLRPSPDFSFSERCLEPSRARDTYHYIAHFNCINSRCVRPGWVRLFVYVAEQRSWWWMATRRSTNCAFSATQASYCCVRYY
jgi:hypothetical protein